jgi:hypothetical protein
MFQKKTSSIMLRKPIMRTCTESRPLHAPNTMQISRPVTSKYYGNDVQRYMLLYFVPLKSTIYEGVSKSFRTGRLERELQMVQLSATRCSYIAILSVSLVSFVAVTLCVASQRVLIVFRYRLSPETFGYTIVCSHYGQKNSSRGFLGHFVLKMQVRSSDMLVSYRNTTLFHNSEDFNKNLHRCQNLRF